MSFGVPSPRTYVFILQQPPSISAEIMHGISSPDTLHRPHAGEAAGLGRELGQVAGIAADRSHIPCTAYVNEEKKV